MATKLHFVSIAPGDHVLMAEHDGYVILLPEHTVTTANQVFVKVSMHGRAHLVSYHRSYVVFAGTEEQCRSLSFHLTEIDKGFDERAKEVRKLQAVAKSAAVALAEKDKSK